MISGGGFSDRFPTWKWYPDLGGCEAGSEVRVKRPKPPFYTAEQIRSGKENPAEAGFSAFAERF
jgi:hypothetical protein